MKFVTYSDAQKVRTPNLNDFLKIYLLISQKLKRMFDSNQKSMKDEKSPNTIIEFPVSR